VFWGDQSNDHWSLYEHISKEFDSVVFLSTSSEAIKAEYNLPSSNFLTVFKKFDEKQASFNGEWSHENVANFIKSHEFPTVMGFDQKIANTIFSDTKPVLFLMT